MTADSIRSQLAPNGTIRFAINYGNPVLAQRGPGGDPAGVSVALARRLCDALQAQPIWVPFETAGEVAASAAASVWDVAFMAIDARRAEAASFTPPYVLIEGTYLVGADSEICHVADVDRDGQTVATGRGAAYDLYLSRHLKHARIVRAATSAAAVECFVTGQASAAAGVRQALQAAANQHPGTRVLDDAFMTIRQAMALPHRLATCLPWLSAFVEAAKAEGQVATALQSSGVTATVAPPESP